MAHGQWTFLMNNFFLIHFSIQSHWFVGHLILNSFFSFFLRKDLDFCIDMLVRFFKNKK